MSRPNAPQFGGPPKKPRSPLFKMVVAVFGVAALLMVLSIMGLVITEMLCSIGSTGTSSDCSTMKNLFLYLPVTAWNLATEGMAFIQSLIGARGLPIPLGTSTWMLGHLDVFETYTIHTLRVAFGGRASSLWQMPLPGSFFTPIMNSGIPSVVLLIAGILIIFAVFGAIRVLARTLRTAGEGKVERQRV